MAGETYYFFLSIVLVLGVLFHITNMLYFRAQGRTIIGNKYKHDTVEYKRLRKLSSTGYLSGAYIAGLIFATNLGFDVLRLARLSDRNYSHFILIFAPTASVALFFGLILYAYNTFGKGQSGKHN